MRIVKLAEDLEGLKAALLGLCLGDAVEKDTDKAYLAGMIAFREEVGKYVENSHLMRYNASEEALRKEVFLNGRKVKLNPGVKKLMPHVGHKLECVVYGDGVIAENIAIECVDCCEVLVDYNLMEDDS